MLRAATIALATFVFSVVVAADVVMGQTTSPTASPTVSPTTAPTGSQTVPSGAPNTGRG